VSGSRIVRALRRKNVFPALKAVRKDEAIREILDNLEESGELSAKLAKSAHDALMARERLGSTGIGNGIAIPHVKLKGGPEETIVAIGRSDAGVEFASIDGDKVKVIFLVISQEDHPEDHLSVLKSISTLVRDGYRHRLLLGSRTPEDFLDLFKEPGA
jgi:mannitol/fructose-specific phosphotransferase system IIA component (Ntr-type)